MIHILGIAIAQTVLAVAVAQPAQMRLYEERINCPDGSRVVVVEMIDKTDYDSGCWKSDGDWVQVTFSSRKVRVYDASIFTWRGATS